MTARAPLGSAPRFEAEAAPPEPRTTIPSWLVALVCTVAVTASVGIVGWLSSRIGAIEARETERDKRIGQVVEEQARRGTQVDDLRGEVHDLRGEVRAGFEATRASIAALSAQITAASPRKDRP